MKSFIVLISLTKAYQQSGVLQDQNLLHKTHHSRLESAYLLALVLPFSIALEVQIKDNLHSLQYQLMQ